GPAVRPAAAAATRAAAASTPARASGASRAGAPRRQSRSSWARVVAPGTRVSGVKAASEDAGVKGGGADPVGQLGRMPRVPDGKVGAQTRSDAAAVVQPERGGGMPGDACERLLRRQAEEGAGHVHRQR